VVPDIVRRLVERGLPVLVMAGAAGHPDVSQARGLVRLPPARGPQMQGFQLTWAPPGHRPVPEKGRTQACFRKLIPARETIMPQEHGG